jgi:ketosteroid isomerase-like protein
MAPRIGAVAFIITYTVAAQAVPDEGGGGRPVRWVRVKGRDAIPVRHHPARRSVGVQIRSALVVLLGAAVACRGGHAPGPSFAGTSLLAPPSDAEAAHDQLLKADLSRGDSSSRRGYGESLTAPFAGDIVYLRGGLPIVRGKAAARLIAAAESLPANATVRWQPVRADVSQDRRSGYTYGYAIIGAVQPEAPTLRVDRYIAFWRKEQGGWRIAAYAETYGSAPSPLAVPREAASAVLPNVPMSRAGGALDAIRAADIEFSNDAAKYGTGEAFGRYAAEGAQMFSGAGELVTGPGAIAELFGPLIDGSSLVWHPVHGEMATSGDLGFTVGYAVFNGKREDGTPLVRYSKYLTVWKRQRDGSWRYVVDGGSGRPGG